MISCYRLLAHLRLVDSGEGPNDRARGDRPATKDKPKIRSMSFTQARWAPMVLVLYIYTVH